MPVKPPFLCSWLRDLSRPLVLVLASIATLCGTPFPEALKEAAVDFAACRVLEENDSEPVEAGAIRELLGLTRANEPAKVGRPARSGQLAGLQYLIVFKQPAAIGTVLGGIGELRVLTPNAALPPEPTRAADWLAVEVQPSQSAPRFAPLPAGTKTRALLMTVPSPRDSRQAPFLRLLAPRLANAESEYTATSSAAPPYTYDAGHLTRGHGEWVNSGKDDRGINSRAPIIGGDCSAAVFSSRGIKRLGLAAGIGRGE